MENNLESLIFQIPIRLSHYKNILSFYQQLSMQLERNNLQRETLRSLMKLLALIKLPGSDEINKIFV